MRPFFILNISVFLVVLGLSILPAALAAQTLHAQPMLRNGSCPSNFHASGNYCAPGAYAHYALPKSGPCPSGYSSSGNYCVAYSANAKLAIPKLGSCPSGYSSSSNYCVAYR